MGGKFLGRLPRKVADEFIAENLAKNPAFQRFAARTSMALEVASERGSSEMGQVMEQIEHAASGRQAQQHAWRPLLSAVVAHQQQPDGTRWSAACPGAPPQAMPIRGLVTASASGGRSRLVKRPFQRAMAAAAPGGAPGFVVQLDSKDLMTPAKRPVRVPTLPLAFAIAAEWEWQEGLRLRPYTMPLMKLAATAIDQIPSDRPNVISSLLEFFHTDQVLVRHPDPPEERDFMDSTGETATSLFSSSFGESALKGASWIEDQRQLCERQRQVWDPLVAWMREGLGVEAATTTECLPPPQAEAALAALQQHLQGLDDWELAAVDSLAGAARSVCIGLALSEGRLDVHGALAAARLEEEHQIASGGFVEGGHDIDVADLKVKLIAPSVFLQLLRTSG